MPEVLALYELVAELAPTRCDYGSLNHMLTLGGDFSAGYRWDGLRAWKQNASGQRTYFHYDGDGNVLAETENLGNVTAVNDFAPNGLVGRKTNNTWVYYAFDTQGNVIHRLDSSGNVLTNHDYDAYGAGSNVDCFGYNARWGYYFDSETGLYYCQNRYYDPGTGMWVTRDPIGFDGGLNMYGYCGGSPLGMFDYLGLERLHVAENKGGVGQGSHVMIGLEDNDGNVTWYGFYPDDKGDGSSESSGKTSGSLRGTSGGTCSRGTTGPGYVRVGDTPGKNAKVDSVQISSDEYNKMKEEIMASKDRHAKGKGRDYDLYKYDCADWAFYIISCGGPEIPLIPKKKVSAMTTPRNVREWLTTWER